MDDHAFGLFEDVKELVQSLETKLESHETRLEEVNISLKNIDDRIQEMNVWIDDIDNQIQEVKVSINNIDNRIQRLEKKQQNLQESVQMVNSLLSMERMDRFDSCMTDFIVVVARFIARKLEKTEFNHKHSIHDLAKFAQALTDEQLEQAGVPSKHKIVLNRMPDLVSQHTWDDYEDGFEDKNLSGKLAKILLNPFFWDKYLKYKDLFFILYGKTIQQKAREYDACVNELLRG